jgi:hypothetical protein
MKPAPPVINITYYSNQFLAHYCISTLANRKELM